MFEQRHVNLTGDPLTASLATRISARRTSSCPLVVTKNTVFDQPTRYVSVNLRLTTEAEEELPMWLKDFCTFSGGFRYDLFAIGIGLIPTFRAHREPSQDLSSHGLRGLGL